MKATDVIRRDHEAAKELFQRFREASEEEREEMETDVFDALTMHERMEDKHFYPALREKLSDTKLLNQVALDQKKLEVEVLAARGLPGDKSDRILSMIDTVLEHAEWEESEILPKAEAALSSDELEELGEVMEPESAAVNAK
jgi:hemerythrin superfamily protein